MKVYYFNDTKKDMLVQVNHGFVFDKSNPMKMPQIDYFTVKPLQTILIDLIAPANAIPYLKQWDDKLLITHLELEQVRVQPSSEK